jgi:hypothetical protein
MGGQVEVKIFLALTSNFELYGVHLLMITNANLAVSDFLFSLKSWNSSRFRWNGTNAPPLQRRTGN